ncbi:pilus assembly protein TadA [Halobacteriovorax vibrionivorans]|uniref:Pilus assembly protein TadA n=1 Tax=Halobacteriovorax vibrionivorans TaxID=2152716 RepID=A0ABY0IJT8_9BACT|nr:MULTISPECIES: ATPase, T2SS/T4P/T4SS family [Halobacteriovorax]RZF23233.1 pilus assembly protein TadA [Halobacteriovorax vibrionivorans]TGD46386.1 pilus assembly protein TadA [Halobacteriovorax sp. Y22]
MAEGHIIAVIGGKGGVGKSQVATNLAFAFSGEKRSKTLLLDFDQKASGDLNLLTGIKTNKNLKDLFSFNGNIDPRSFQPFVNMHPSGVHYIGLPNDPVATEGMSVDNAGKVLKAAKNMYPTTIIDVGTEINDLTAKALEHATMILVVITPDLLALNQTKRMVSELITMMFPKEMIHFVFNQAQKGHPVSADVAGKSVGRPVLAQVPKDDQTCAMALNQKKPIMLAAKNSAFAKGIIELTRTINGKGILNQLAKLNKPSGVGVKKERSATGAEANSWRDLKLRIHKALVEEMDLSKDDDNDPKAKIILKEKTKKIVIELLGKEDTKGIVNNRDEMNSIVKEILDEALGLGPLEDLLADPLISEIMVVGPSKIYYEEDGKVKLSKVTFSNDRQVLNVIERIVAPIGRRIDEKTPYVDARLHDGSRVHAIIPPSAIDGCCITIRKFPEERLTHKHLVQYGSITQNMADFMRIAVEGHKNIIVSGGTGSGKTTLVNVLGSFIQANERIITCEDSAELSFPQEHVVRLETRPPSLEGDGEIDIRCLVKQCLRMRPERIVVGECRGGETLDMLQAMGTGHDGSLTTVHSNNPRECIGRIETLVQYAGAGLTPKAIRDMIANAVHLIIQASRLDDGSRKITHITEIGGIQGDVVTLQDIFLFQQKDIDKNGKIIGSHQATGFIPKFIETLERQGYNIPRGLFSNTPGGGAPGQKPAAPPKAPGNRPPQKGQKPGQRPPQGKPQQRPGVPPVKKKA